MWFHHKASMLNASAGANTHHTIGSQTHKNYAILYSHNPRSIDMIISFVMRMHRIKALEEREKKTKAAFDGNVSLNKH